MFDSCEQSRGKVGPVKFGLDIPEAVCLTRAMFPAEHHPRAWCPRQAQSTQQKGFILSSTEAAAFRLINKSSTHLWCEK